MPPCRRRPMKTTWSSASSAPWTTVPRTGAIYGVTSYHSDVLWQGTSDEIPLPEGWFIEKYTIESYLWDTIDMGLHATRETWFETPVSVPLA